MYDSQYSLALYGQVSQREELPSVDLGCRGRTRTARQICHYYRLKDGCRHHLRFKLCVVMPLQHGHSHLVEWCELLTSSDATGEDFVQEMPEDYAHAEDPATSWLRCSNTFCGLSALCLTICLPKCLPICVDEAASLHSIQVCEKMILCAGRTCLM